MKLLTVSVSFDMMLMKRSVPMSNNINSMTDDSRKALIIEAGITSMAFKGYKKSSIADIAKSAGVSKSLVLYHFPNKYNLAISLFNYSTTLISNIIPIDQLLTLTDLFDRINFVTQKKIELLKEQPAIFKFLHRMLQEDEPSLKNEVRKLISMNQLQSQQVALQNIDTSRFKEGIDVNKVFQMITYLTDGFFESHPIIESEDSTKITNELDSYLALLKKSFYKED